MKVYHGSYTTISLIDLSKCEKHKDFGQGFYVTRFSRQAEEWAKKIGQKNNTRGATINRLILGSYTYFGVCRGVACNASAAVCCVHDRDTILNQI